MPALKSPTGVLVEVSEEKAQSLLLLGFTTVESQADESTVDQAAEPTEESTVEAPKKPTRRTTKG